MLYWIGMGVLPLLAAIWGAVELGRSQNPVPLILAVLLIILTVGIIFFTHGSEEQSDASKE